MTTKILTFRVPAPIYSDLCASAAELGIPLSAHIRNLIEQEQQANQVSMLRVELMAKLESLSVSIRPQSQVSPVLLEELLLLTRGTAAHLSPQLVAQVKAKLVNSQ
jgi:hypothetical protein